MRRFDIKSIFVGFALSTIGLTTAFAASGIRSATFSHAKVTLDGVSVPLSNSLVAIVQDGEKDAKLYMPVRELLEYMGYTVNWDGASNTVDLISDFKSNNYSNFGPPVDKPQEATSSTDAKEQIINNVHVEKLGSLEYVTLGTYELSKGDMIHYDVSASGNGNLSLGFVKSGDDPAKTTKRYFTAFNPGSNKTKMSTMATEPILTDAAEKYTLYVCNISDNPLSDIKGIVIIEKDR